MFSITLSWSEFSARVGDGTIRYADTRGNYYLYYTTSDTEYVCVLDKNSASDFENNYKASSTSIT